jgi:hypothetical protein
MALRLNIWKILPIVVAVAALWLWGGLGRQDTSVIIIEFGVAPTEFEGLEVVIDDEVVGTLKKLGARTQTGFKVSDGDHVVCVRHPELPCEPARVTSGFGGQRVMLMADFASRYENGEDQTYIVLQR